MRIEARGTSLLKMKLRMLIRMILMMMMMMKSSLGEVTNPNSRIKQVGKVKPLRDSRRERSAWKSTHKTKEENPLKFSKRIQVKGGKRYVESSIQRSRSSKSNKKLLPGKKNPV